MRPAKIYNGTDSAVEGIFLTDGNGQILCYHNPVRKSLQTSFIRTRVWRKVP